jgi:hypothetical protein
MGNRCVTCVLVIAGLLSIVSFSRANAATVGQWSRTCTAPNWITGVPEAVPDSNINNPNMNFWGLTSKLPGGHWMTQYNLAKITAGPDVMIFLFYHECSHAKFNSTSETVADC